MTLNKTSQIQDIYSITPFIKISKMVKKSIFMKNKENWLLLEITGWEGRRNASESMKVSPWVQNVLCS